MLYAILTYMKEILGFEGRYAVTKDGRVWAYPRTRSYDASSIRRDCTKHYAGRWLKDSINKYGYKQLTLWKDGKGYAYRIHKLVAESYLTKLSDKLVVNHKDGNKLNNNVANLEWVTHAENTQHAFKLGLMVARRGEDNNMSRFKENDIKEMRDMYESGINRSQIAKKYRTSKTHVNKIVKRIIWKHIE